MAKTVLAVLTAFIISFTILCTGLFLYHDSFQDGKWFIQPTDKILNQKNFYSQVSDIEQKKIFLIGSSQVEPLNTNYIHADLLENGLNFTVYNLGIGGDVPKDRVKTIDWIISAKPDIVVYGIGDRDFPIYDSSLSDSSTNTLPSMHDTIQNWLLRPLQDLQDSFYFLHSPKLDFLKFTFGGNSTQTGEFRTFFTDPKVYANYLETENWPIANNRTLEIQSQESRLYDIFPLENNVDYNAFNKMLKQLHENKITIIVYVTPQERHRLEKIPYPTQFTSTLNDISQKYPHVPIYSLWDKYADTPVWKDYTHVINNSNKTNRIYSDDIAKMILETSLPNALNLQGFKNNTDYPPKFDYKLEFEQRSLN